MDSKVNYVVVGIFVLLLGAALLAGALWFSSNGVHGRTRDYVTYTTESVSGLNVDAAVRFQGVRVGRVSEIELTPGDPGRVRLVLEISAEAPVRTDTVATLEMQGLTGLMNVNLVGGSRTAPHLSARPGELPVIPYKPSLIGQLNAQAEALASRLNDTSERLNRLLSDQNQAALSRTLQNLDKLTSGLAEESQTIADTFIELRRAAHQARMASEDLPATIQQFNRSAAALERMAEELTATSATVRSEVATGGAQMRRFMGDTLPAAGAIADELRETAASLRRASETLERDPSVLLYGAEAPEPGPGE